MTWRTVRTSGYRSNTGVTLPSKYERAITVQRPRQFVDIPPIQQEAAAYDFAAYMSCVENLLDGRWPHEQPVGCFFQK